jgi:acyl-CoA reductase-like NAD-dependent aldehyde dehydrogenase
MAKRSNAGTSTRNGSPDLGLPVLKTFKLYIGGQFSRSESGRYYSPEVGGRPIGNICLASRKDLRNAVVSARAAQVDWARRSSYNRGQILYRIAEMLEGRTQQFEAELVQQGETAQLSAAEVRASIDRIVYYAGWCD